jgi:hypothetical protein
MTEHSDNGRNKFKKIESKERTGKHNVQYPPPQKKTSGITSLKRSKEINIVKI